ncbi:GDYXXLXY domain-containing protein [Rheinheimera metallidurans]|uniref:GDYXXLXY domain-containing protein n=1 Tax=Rheinheimera metallidurans TaxID=2925781 RepID=UPI00300342FD
MTQRLQRFAIASAIALILIVTSYTIWQFERTLADGQIVNIELAPVDPRSLMQGDYMALAFAIDRDLPDDAAQYKYAWLSLDNQQRASLHSVANDLPTDLALVAVLLRQRDNIISIGPNAFFFAEGTADVYEQARYGQFRIAGNGKALLTVMLDAELNLLGDNLR